MAIVTPLMPAEDGAEVYIEETTMMAPEGIEFIPEEDGMIVDFEPSTDFMPEMLPHGANLAEFIDDDVLRVLGSELIDLYKEDVTSRQDWLDSFSDGLKLLGTENEERTEPFEGATGVHHPLLAEAATQFQAQAYKELLPAGGPVSVATVGTRPTPQEGGEDIPPLVAQATRVKEFMNYQITSVMEEYDPELDQMLFYLPLSGSAFKKVYYDASMGRAVSKFVTAEDLVVNYTATDLKSAARITHVINISENDVRKQQVYGFYKDVDLKSPSEPESNILQETIDELQGIKPTGNNGQYTLLEMHVNLDVPGFEDTYPETGEPTGVALPYIVTVVEDTGQILSIRKNWLEEDQLKAKRDYFVHYKFLPGLGFYGFGLIHMIGGLSKSATSILRQLIDAGTLSNLPAGFKARGMRVMNEEEPIAPGEWRDVDAPGGSLRESLMPLPYKEPSAVLYQLLGMIVESGRRFAAIADMALSETGSQQNPVGTTLALLERGSKVMSAIHKRLHYAQRKEFKLLARIFSETLPEYPYPIGDNSPSIAREDFDDRIDVIPVSDPNIFSTSQRILIAQQQLQMAQAAPDIHDLREAYRRMYDAMEIKDADQLLKKKDKPSPRTPAQEFMDILQNKRIQAFPGQNHMMHVQSLIGFAQNPMIQGVPDFYTNVLQGIAGHLNMMAIQQVEREVRQMSNGQQIPPEAMKQMQPQIQNRVTELESQMLQQILQQMTPPEKPDPMIAMHEKEMQIKAATEQQRSENEQAKIEADLLKAQMMTQAKREQIQAQILQNEQRVAQGREEAFLDADVKRQKSYMDLQKEIARSRNGQL